MTALEGSIRYGYFKSEDALIISLRPGFQIQEQNEPSDEGLHLCQIHLVKS